MSSYIPAPYDLDDCMISLLRLSIKQAYKVSNRENQKALRHERVGQFVTILRRHAVCKLSHIPRDMSNSIINAITNKSNWFDIGEPAVQTNFQVSIIKENIERWLTRAKNHVDDVDNQFKSVDALLIEVDEELNQIRHMMPTVSAASQRAEKAHKELIELAIEYS